MLTPYQLRSRYIALHKDVYVPRDAKLTAQLRAKALWLRSRRRGVLAGHSASVLHGARWVDPGLPAAIIDSNARHEPGIQVWEDRIEADEVCVVDGVRVTTRSGRHSIWPVVSRWTPPSPRSMPSSRRPT